MQELTAEQRSVANVRLRNALESAAIAMERTETGYSAVETMLNGISITGEANVDGEISKNLLHILCDKVAANLDKSPHWVQSHIPSPNPDTISPVLQDLGGALRILSSVTKIRADVAHAMLLNSLVLDDALARRDALDTFINHLKTQPDYDPVIGDAWEDAKSSFDAYSESFVSAVVEELLDADTVMNIAAFSSGVVQIVAAHTGHTVLAGVIAKVALPAVMTYAIWKNTRAWPDEVRTVVLAVTLEREISAYLHELDGGIGNDGGTDEYSRLQYQLTLNQMRYYAALFAHQGVHNQMARGFLGACTWIWQHIGGMSSLGELKAWLQKRIDENTFQLELNMYPYYLATFDVPWLVERIGGPVGSNELSWFELAPGEEKTIGFTVGNTGATANEFYISVSLSNGLDVTQAGSKWQRYDIGSGVNAVNDTTVTTDYLLYDFYTEDATNDLNSEQSLTIQATGNGAQWIKYRVAMSGDSGQTFARVPNSGLSDQQGWYAYQVDAEILGTPYPSISVEPDFFQLREGSEMEVIVSVENSGGRSEDAYVDISHSANLDVISIIPAAGFQHYPPGEQIWTSAGGQIPAAHDLYSLFTPYFPAEGSATFHVRIRGATAGENQFVRSRVSLKPYGGNDFARAPSSGQKDQQGWHVVEILGSVNQNRPPQFVSLSPQEGSRLDLEEGDSQLFEVTATDPDGDTVRYTWLLDGVEKGSGNTYRYEAPVGSEGEHVVGILIQDGDPDAPDTLQKYESWLVDVSRPTPPNPTTPPVIYPGSIAVRDLTQNSARIIWQTDRPADSYVYYGETAALGNEVSNSDYVTDHSLQLSGLTAGTKYYYRVAGSDEYGNGPTESAIYNFTTPSVPVDEPLFFTYGPALEEITDVTATLYWKTSKLSSGQVKYGLSQNTLNQTKQGTQDGDIYRATLSSLQAGTWYYYKVEITDLVGSQGTISSLVQRFRTSDLPTTEPPVIIAGPIATGISDTGAMIVWDTNKPTTGMVGYTDNSERKVKSNFDYKIHHVIALTNLKPDTEYTYTVLSVDHNGNGTISDLGLKFRTLAHADTTPPTIIAPVKIFPITNGTVKIFWYTDEISDTATRYRAWIDPISPENIGYVSDPEMTLNHELILTGLTRGSYWGQFLSTDLAGNTGKFLDPSPVDTVPPRLKTTGVLKALIASSTDIDENQFDVPIVDDATPPVFLVKPRAVSTSDTRITLAWETDELTTGYLEYGINEANPEFTIADVKLTNEHMLAITDLFPGVRYYYTLYAYDFSGNGPTSATGVFSAALIADITAPEILSGPTVTDIGEDWAQVSWTTDELSDSRIYYDFDSVLSYSRETLEDSTKHEVILTSLAPGTEYNYQVSSIDPYDNGPTSSTIDSFTTLGQAPTSTPTSTITPTHTTTPTSTLTATPTPSVTVTPTSESTLTPTPSATPGVLTGWQILFEVSGDWQKTDYSGPCDVHQDGKVDELDLFELMKEWHE